jgi:hypothetical protein
MICVVETVTAGIGPGIHWPLLDRHAGAGTALARELQSCIDKLP